MRHARAACASVESRLAAELPQLLEEGLRGHELSATVRDLLPAVHERALDLLVLHIRAAADHEHEHLAEWHAALRTLAWRGARSVSLYLRVQIEERLVL
eukprot:CAMPEP_0182549152 /NCGR_PEP_ID=MMETSP1323-20130603/39832_1 /TAXON_ID=236787 /ORGANISM="Florenciella parvula, Strain RCC1693" /LENGTH=98 /DNA_ID=CAMNT_0024760595 /DNA_START=93 /DNA_END=389 /DNA_ORIENTATION=-